MKHKVFERVAAGIVLYNSDYDRLEKCLKNLYSQVEKIIVFDNSPQVADNKKIDTITTSYKCKYMFSEKNIGMPEALNKIMEYAEKEGFDWVLTMNADSIVPNNMMEVYRRYFGNKTIGMLCPQVVDKRRKYMTVDTNKNNEFIEMCITSAACTRIAAWRQVGKFDGYLFVDLLDNDISKRMILNGWKIYQLNSVILDQEFGEIKTKSKRTETFWVYVGKRLKNDNFAKLSYKKIVHANRVYYTCRNIIYLNKKYKNYGGIGYRENYNCNTFIGFVFCFVLPSILRAEKKLEVLVAVIKGFEAGLQKRVIPWIAEPRCYGG